ASFSLPSTSPVLLPALLARLSCAPNSQDGPSTRTTKLLAKTDHTTCRQATAADRSIDQASSRITTLLQCRNALYHASPHLSASCSIAHLSSAPASRSLSLSRPSLPAFPARPPRRPLICATSNRPRLHLSLKTRLPLPHSSLRALSPSRLSTSEAPTRLRITSSLHLRVVKVNIPKNSGDHTELQVVSTTLQVLK
ncbi:hypothetical protein B0H16DRAFT_390135, partial [Mycena metata]